ncbi:MAG TPA: DUF2142 domain-containing protein [Candidatus Polarisedimenticolia bacterium]|nr:DUF2142 domain-containing protein [Candidatus Polarisedimenticolia bacterium]
MLTGGGRRLLPPTLIGGLFLLCGTLWSLAIPPFETPDEPGHARYVSFLMEQRRLPVPGRDAAGEAHQPPLYYALCAAVASTAGVPPIAVEPEKNPSFRWYGGTSESKYLHRPDECPPLSGAARSLHLLRLISVVLAAGTVLLVHRLATALSMSPTAAAAAACFAGFLPQHTFIAASLNNDNLSNLLACASLTCMAIAIRDPARRSLWLSAGVLAGTGLLAKFTGLTLLPCGLIAAWLAPRGPGAAGRRDLLGRLTLFLAPAVVIPLPLLWRNYVTLGDPLGAGSQLETLPQLMDRKTLLSSYFFTEFPAVLFRSFWGTFGWMSFRLPSLFYAVCLALTLAAVAGLIVMRRDRLALKLHAFLGAAIGIQIAQIVIFNLTFTQAQGRFLFPVLGPIAVLFCEGVREVTRRLGMRSMGPYGAALMIAFSALANMLLLGFLVAPAYVLE